MGFEQLKMSYETDPDFSELYSNTAKGAMGPFYQQDGFLFKEKRLCIPHGSMRDRSKVVHDLSPRDKEILNPKEEEPSSQGKSSKSEDLKYQTCYRCHKKGHYAIVCPTKKALIETSLEEKTELSMKSDSLIQSDILVPNSCIMHLSLSKGDVTGTKEHEFKGEDRSVY